jgi:RNA polymerase primary sigma factor
MSDPDAARAEHDLVVAAGRRDPRAREQLVEAFLPLIGSVARIYHASPGVDRAELMQEGVVGMLRALERYDPTLGTPFWAYASWWVRQAMQQLVAELSRPVVLSDRALRQLAHVREARREHAQANGREPSVRELASALDLRVEQIQSLLVAERAPRGLDEPVGDGATMTFGDLVRDPQAEEVFDDVGIRITGADLPRLLACLDERERMVLRDHYGLGGKARTLRELASVLGVSAERVRQIEQCALERLRDEVRPL